MSSKKESRWLLGITGASGAIYASRLLHHMHRWNLPMDVVVSNCGMQVLEYEKQIDGLSLASRVFDDHDLFASPASGSSPYVSMAVLPCSMGTLGRIAGGISDTLLTRAADVCLKEKRPLVVVPREMPFSRIHLDNMLRIQGAGATIIAASPSFYRHPESINDLVDSVLAKVCEHLGLPQDLVPEWSRPS